MKTEILEKDNRLFHITIETTDNRWFYKITVHEITHDGIKYKGKIISNDIETAVNELITRGRK